MEDEKDTVERHIIVSSIHHGLRQGRRSQTKRGGNGRDKAASRHQPWHPGHDTIRAVRIISYPGIICISIWLGKPQVELSASPPCASPQSCHALAQPPHAPHQHGTTKNEDAFHRMKKRTISGAEQDPRRRSEESSAPVGESERQASRTCRRQRMSAQPAGNGARSDH